MGRVAAFDREAVAALQARQDGLITWAQARQCRMTEDALRHRTRPGGAWQVLLPGVYLTATGTPTLRQRHTAALLYAGDGSVITGLVAMANHGLPVRDIDGVDVLIPIERRRRSIEFVRIYRTSRMPEAYVDREIRFASPVRAVADAVRRSDDVAEIRQMVAWAVQMSKVRIDALAAEIDSGPVAGAARARRVLGEVADGIRSAAEGDLRTLIRKARLPEPLYNPDLFGGRGFREFIARPDAWWPAAGVAVEIDSRQWHLSPAHWARTMERHSSMSAYGIVVLHYPPARLRAEPNVIAAQIRSALENGRELPGIRTVPVGSQGR